MSEGYSISRRFTPTETERKHFRSDILINVGDEPTKKGRRPWGGIVSPKCCSRPGAACRWEDLEQTGTGKACNQKQRGQASEQSADSFLRADGKNSKLSTASRGNKDIDIGSRIRGKPWMELFYVLIVAGRIYVSMGE